MLDLIIPVDYRCSHLEFPLPALSASLSVIIAEISVLVFPVDAMRSTALMLSTIHLRRLPKEDTMTEISENISDSHVSILFASFLQSWIQSSK